MRVVVLLLVVLLGWVGGMPTPHIRTYVLTHLGTNKSVRTVVAQPAGHPVAHAHEGAREVGDPSGGLQEAIIENDGLLVCGGEGCVVEWIGFFPFAFTGRTDSRVFMDGRNKNNDINVDVCVYLEAEDEPHVEEVHGPGGGAGQLGVVLSS